MKTTTFEKIIPMLWSILMIILIIVEKFAGKASGGEFVIALLLWYDVSSRIFDKV